MGERNGDYMSERRRIMMKKSGNTELGYVTDGLQLLLDGEFNTRSGHDATSTVWEDLSGNQADWSLTGATINDAHVDFDGSMQSYGALIDTNKGTLIFGSTLEADGTVEVVCRLPNTFAGDAINANNGTFNQNGKSVNYGNNQENYTIQLSGRYTADNSYFFRAREVVSGNTKGIYSWRAVFGATLSAYCNNILLNNGVTGISPRGSIRYRIGNFGGKNQYQINIYSIRVYNRIITQEEMLHNYTIDQSRFNLGGA